MQVAEMMQTNAEPVSIDSDRESTKSDTEYDSLPAKKQNMFIWNQDFEVSCPDDELSSHYFASCKDKMKRLHLHEQFSHHHALLCVSS